MPLLPPRVSRHSVRVVLARWLTGALAIQAGVLATLDALFGWGALSWIVLAAIVTGYALYFGLAKTAAAPLSGLLADAEHARYGHSAAEPFRVSGGGLEEADRVAVIFNDMGHDYFESRRQLQEAANLANAALVSTVEQLQTRTAELNQKTVELERALETINQIATTDSLTGLNNRRYFDGRLAEIFARAQRYEEPTALILIDVDKFKEINDTLGHDAGDAVLADLGGIIKSRTRASDVSARLGGDEFVFVLPRTGADEAYALAEDLLARVVEHEFLYGNTRIPVTLSIGVSHYLHVPRAAEAIYKAADDALYQAKRGGRNRVAMLSATA